MKKFILLAFYTVLSITIALIIAISFIHPQNNLISWHMIVGTALMLIGLAIVSYYWSTRRHQDNRILRFSIAAIMCFILYVLGCVRGLRFGSFGDYPIVYNSALEMALQGELSSPKYFLTYGNNLRPMLFLSVLFKISFITGINEYYITLAVSVLTTVAAIWAVGELMDKPGIFGIPAMIFTALCLPIYVFTPSFYTDTMSFGVGLISLALIKKAIKKERHWQFGLIIAGFLIIYGAMWKITSLIPIIAAGIAVTLRNIKIERKKVVFGMFSIIFFALIFNIWSRSYPIYNESKKVANPISSWFAIGMLGDGSWLSNRDFADALNSLESKDQKKEFTEQYIKQNFSKSLSLTHLISKAQYNFAGGTFSAKDYLSAENDGTVLWELMAPWGKYYWRTSQYCFCYMLAIYITILIGCIVGMVDISKGGVAVAYKINCRYCIYGNRIILNALGSQQQTVIQSGTDICSKSVCKYRIFIEQNKKK